MMYTATQVLESNADIPTDSGVLLIIDRQQHSAMSEETRYWLSVFTDPEAGTNIVADFDQPWPRVWTEAASRMAAFGGSGRFIVLKGPPGRYFVRVALGTAADDHASVQSLATQTAHVTVRSGQLQIVGT